MTITKALNAILFITVMPSGPCFSQNLQREINDQVWRVQLEAMNANQADKFISVMSADVVQISYDRNTIRGKDEFYRQAQATYQRIADRKLTRTMEFRFLSRIATKISAFEDGFYKYEMTNEKLEKQTYYGYFQVVLRKEDEVWKVLVDYDAANYGGTPVTQEMFQGAKPMSDYDK
ncbi:MAG: nuclear transport factor 2 family protein [Cyclobacteriaceae bacterium]|nr:nuclear transport factor 2 family protein [Cyclobacteriaceae bacterium]MBX2956795.1 nuclear transport factor 2 family protein [Cyclobacteriaceae bacterium]